jgi:hypothetical protein
MAFTASIKLVVAQYIFTGCDINELPYGGYGAVFKGNQMACATLTGLCKALWAAAIK